MLHEFVSTHREDLIRRCRFKAAQRASPPANEDDLRFGVPLVLEQLFEALVREAASPTSQEDAVFGYSPANPGAVESVRTAALHGSALFRLGYTVDEVVHDYGDVCQALTELAYETESPVTVEEFHTVNRVLENSIAAAVSSYVRLHHSSGLHEGAQVLHERLGALAQEQRGLLDTALNALQALKAADAGATEAKGIVLEDSLLQLRDLVDRSLPEIRTAWGMVTPSQGPGSLGVRTWQVPQHATKGNTMNWDRIQGNWKEFKGNAKQQWGKLTDDQLDTVAGKRESLAGKIQEAYGLTKEETEKQLSAWESRQKDLDQAK